ADSHLLGRGEAPAVAGRHVGAVDPHLERDPVAMRMDLEPARERRIGWLEAVRPQHPPPSQAIDDEGRHDLAPVGLDHDRIAVLRTADRGPRTSLDLRRLEPRLALLPHKPAELAVVKGRERPW